MDRFLIPKIPRVEESCDVEEEEEMQGVSESDLEEEERRGQRDQPYTSTEGASHATPGLLAWPDFGFAYGFSSIVLFAFLPVL